MGAVIAFREALATEWDDAWDACSWASYFQSRAWAEAWSSWRPDRYRSGAWLIELASGGSVLLPFVEERRARGWLTITRLSVADTYGSWLAATDVTDDDAMAIVRWVRTKYRDLTWVLSPFDPTAAKLELPDARRAETLVVDLAPGFDVIRRDWSKGHRAAASQARREGVSVRLGSSAADWDAYGACYVDSVGRWGGRAGGAPFGLVRTLDRDSRNMASLCLAEVAGSVVAGAVFLEDHERMTYWHAAATADGLRMRAPTLVVEEGMRMAAAHSKAVFDLGGSGGHEGVARFKLGFRPRRVTYAVIVGESLRLRAARAIRRLVP